MSRYCVLVAAILSISALFVSSRAAAQCDTVNLNDNNNVAIVGEVLTWNAGLGAYIPVGAGRLGVCWQDGSGGSWYLVTTSCSAYSSWNRLRVNAGDGDDVVVAHPAGASSFYCGSTSNVIVPAGWSSSHFNLGLDVYLEEGSDTFHGTAMSDVCRSNDFALNDDGYGDTLCGYGDSDGLYGDADSTTGWANNECLNGGAGTMDVCDGGTNSSPDHDDAWYCETVSNTYNSTGWTAACRDACTPPDLSPAAQRCPTYCLADPGYP